jgi:hypothetical protein
MAKNRFQVWFRSVLAGIVILLLIVVVQVPFVLITDSGGTADTMATAAEANNGLVSSSRAKVDREMPDAEVMYAIIAPNAFQDALIPLVNWKTYKGVPAKIYPLEDIYASYTGRDNAERVHKFLRNLDKTSKVLTWVLLVGDSDIVPVRKVRAEAAFYGLNDDYISDYYYAGLDTNWDKNNDSVFGDGTADSSLKFEGDWSPNVYVGRLPAANVTEVEWCVDDILDYETDPIIDTWMKRVVMWGGLMDGPNRDSDPHKYTAYDSNAYKAKEFYVKPIIEQLAPHMIINTRYDYAQLEGGEYVKSNDGLYQSLAVGDFNTGASLINFAGQAYYEGIALLHYNDATGMKYIGQSGAFVDLFNWTDARDATNGKRLPLVTSFTCGAGDFAEAGFYEDKTMERLLTAPNGGAIGLIASTGTTYRGEFEDGTSDGNWWMDRTFFDIFFNGTYQQGKAFYEMKERYADEILNAKSTHQERFKAQLFGYNLQGDPEISIWTDEPGAMKVNLTGLWPGPHNITATVYDMSDNVVPSARVCIQNDDFYVYGVTNASGAVAIYANPTQLTSVDVVVTAHNFLPLEQSFNIVQEPVDLMVTTQDIVFSNTNPKVNQQIIIEARITNRGQNNLDSPVKVRFTRAKSASGPTTQIGTDQEITSLVAGNSVVVSVPWSVLPGEHIITVEVDPSGEVTESYEWNNIASSSIYVRKPELFVTSKDITFTPDPVMQAIYQGTNIDIKANIHNNGEATANNVKVSFIDKYEDQDSKTIIQRYIGNYTIPVLNPSQFGTAKVLWSALGGEHEIIVKVDPDKAYPEFNETNNSASQVMKIEYPPVLLPLPDLILNEDTVLENATSLFFYISDKDTILANLVITIDSSDTNCSLVMNEYLSFNIIPNSDWFGTLNATISVSDGLVSVNDTFMITVLPKPDAPRFKDIEKKIYSTEDEELHTFIEAFDPDMDTILYSDDSELFDIDPATGEIRFTPNQNQVNNSPIKFNITISDGVLSTKAQFELFVENVPSPPVVFSIAQQYAEVNKTYRLTVKAFDMDGSRLYFYDNTDIFVININTGEIKFTPTNNDIGLHTIKIIVSDEDYLTGNTTFLLKVNASTEPPIDNNKSNDKTGDQDDEMPMGYVAGVPLLYILLIVIILAVVIGLLMIMVTRKRNQAQAAEFFKRDHDEDADELSHDDHDQKEPKRKREQDKYSELDHERKKDIELVSDKNPEPELDQSPPKKLKTLDTGSGSKDIPKLPAPKSSTRVKPKTSSKLKK